MTNASNELPVFPTSAPAVFRDPAVTSALFSDVLERLAAVVDVDDHQLDQPTPCVGFTVGDLRNHVLGWLEFFAAALSDPTAATARPDPAAFTLASATAASEVVRAALGSIQKAISNDAASQLIVMTGSRMAGDGVLGMALGEYIIHAWDFTNATGQLYSVPDSAVVPAYEFLQGMVAPEYRGADSGFFDAEVEVPQNASPLEKLLGFAGRNPNWRAN